MKKVPKKIVYQKIEKVTTFVCMEKCFIFPDFKNYFAENEIFKN